MLKIIPKSCFFCNFSLKIQIFLLPKFQKFRFRYNETVRLSVLESMVTVLKRPPAHFGDYVKAHFTQRKDTILRHVDRLLEGKGADPSTFQLSFIFTSHGYDLIFYDFIHNYFPILIYSILKIKQVRVRAHPHRP